MEEEFSGPPMNVVLELFLGFVLCISAALSVPGNFLSIHPDSEENRYVETIYLKVLGPKKCYLDSAFFPEVSEVKILELLLLLYCCTIIIWRSDIEKYNLECRIVSLSANLDFMIFNHRAKALPLETDMKLKH
ncbi:hypothetical protein Gogos_013391 [Gossypium gossypioides]|uniref:Uncharacterized protein n=1 Tax=Gossypium gossypioides TaxID=34282 RepID=A0A7J9BVE8_GOSGO|nr:hypothetical protein [Gossypium gossypioides]